MRNHVLILPVDDLSNAAAEAVAHNVKGALAIPHPYGRLQFGADLDLHFRTLIGAGANSNVAAVVVICIEEGWAKRVVDGIAKTGKPVTGFGIELHGDHDTVLRASKVAKEYVAKAQAGEVPVSKLVISRTVQKVDSYKFADRMQNVQVMRQLKSMGIDVQPGMKVSWVITGSKGKQEPTAYTGPDAEAAIKPNNDYYARRVAMTCVLIST